jgi:ATP-binding cassette subfamily B protein
MRGHGGMPLMPMGDLEALKKQPLDRTTARRALTLSRPYARRLALFVGLIVAAAILSALPPLVIRQILDVTIPNADRSQLLLLFFVLLGIAVITGVISLAERFLSSSIGENLIFDLRTRLYRHVHSLPIAFFTRTQTGALITRLNNDVIGAQRALTGTLGGIVDNTIRVTVTLAVMFALEWRVTLIAIALLPVFIVPARIVGKRLQNLARQGMALNAEMNSVMTERFQVAGALLVKLFGNIDTEVAGFADKAEKVAGIGVKQAVTGRVLFAALGFVGTLATGLVYLVGGFAVMDNPGLEIGTIVALGLYVTGLYGPLAQLSNARIDLMTALVSFERVFEVLDIPPTITDAPDARELVDPAGTITFDKVWFRYPSTDGTSIASLEGPHAGQDARASDWILQDINLTFPAGTMTAIVGPSGAGKTTLSQLISRLYDVTDGHVSIDGHDLRTLTYDSVQQAIGVVSQDAHLFHDTIRANLEYANPGASQDQLVAAAKAARIHDTIVALPDGYDTLVGERGYRLSGGEKARLSIARVILKNPRIVVLDEATAHLDTESERLVQQALSEILTGRTSVVIAHRLSTVVAADMIVVLKNGRIVETGRHAELISAKGLYAELARTQFDAQPHA